MNIQKNEPHGIGICDFLLVRAFYVFESPLFYRHHNHKGDVTIIPSAMGIR
jgi:hypothetical protein